MSSLFEDMENAHGEGVQGGRPKRRSTSKAPKKSKSRSKSKGGKGKKSGKGKRKH